MPSFMPISSKLRALDGSQRIEILCTHTHSQQVTTFLQYRRWQLLVVPFCINGTDRNYEGDRISLVSPKYFILKILSLKFVFQALKWCWEFPFYIPNFYTSTSL